MGQTCRRQQVKRNYWDLVDIDEDTNTVYVTKTRYSQPERHYSLPKSRGASRMMDKLKRGLFYVYRLVIFMYFYLLASPVKFMMEFLLAIYEPLLKNGPIYTPKILKTLRWAFNNIGVFLFTYVIPLLLDLIYLTLTSLPMAIYEYGLPFVIDIWNSIPWSNQDSIESATSNGNKFIGKKPWSEVDIKGLTRFSKNFEALLLSDQLSDFPIKVKNTEIRIHRPILAARSPVFASMLESDGTAGKSETLTISDCDSEIFKDFLHYLYTGKIERIGAENVIGLFEMASRYGVPLLKEECDRFIKDSISVDTVCDVLSAGLRLDESGLVLVATQFFLSNTREILLTVKWQKFLEKNTDVANELYKGSLTVSSGNETEHNVNKTKKTSMKIPEYIHLMTLSENIEALFLDDHFSDFTVKVSDREFPVHKTIVASQNDVFASMLQHEMKESINGVLEVSDCDSDVFEAFLFYLYSGKTEKISATNADSLYQVADKYNVSELKSECGRFMKKNVSVECFCDVMDLALVYKDTELFEVATNYFIANAEEVIASKKWKLFSRENHTVTNELYIKRIEYVAAVS